jgi:two-component system, NarL family, sensor histidine kinase UhpB
MSLRATLILWIGLVLIASLFVGGVMVYWHAVRKVDVEMRAAIAVGEHMVHNAVDDVEEAATPLRQLRLLVGDLDGDRHLRATLVSANGAVLARSMPLAPSDPAPRWFYNMLANEPVSTRIVLPSPFGPVGVIVLETDSHNEISEVWSDVMVTLTVLALFCILNAVLVFWTTGRALRPLHDVIAAFGRIGEGDYALQIPERGPLELKQLSHGFNHMAGRLGDMEMRKHRLEEQLVDVQEEERAELAQDLHDDVGPLLFAVSVDLIAMQQHEALRADPQIRARLDATREAVARMQQHVKAILGRLRPPTVADLGLSHSLQRLVGFWRTRYPAVSFQVSTLEENFDPDIGSRIYRIVQESISNALRHGHPGRIDVNVSLDDTGEAIVVNISDDGIGLQPDAHSTGLGLPGMRARVNSLGGVLSVSSGLGGRGVTVSARLPMTERVS